MIRSVVEYNAALARVSELRLQLANQREKLRESGLLDEKIEEMLGDLKSSCARLEKEVEAYKQRTAGTWVPAG
jgi:hypothetical protein